MDVIILERKDREGLWSFVRFDALGSDDLFGVRLPWSDEVRATFVGDFYLKQVGTEVVGTPQSEGVWFALDEARHSREGDVTEAVADSGTTGLGVGDTLTVSYRASAGGGENAADWLFVLGRSKGRTGGARSDGVHAAGLAAQFALHQSRPNPSSRTTTFGFDLPWTAEVKLEVFDIRGRRVAQLANGELGPGYHSVTWDRTSRSGQRAPAGVYLYRLQAGPFRAERKMVLMQ